MNPLPDALTRGFPVSEDLAGFEEHLRCRLGGMVRDFKLVATNEGLVLRGHAHTYYAKQLAQQAVLTASTAPIVANEIEVS
jgi:hypothetical protein